MNQWNSSVNRVKEAYLRCNSRHLLMGIIDICAYYNKTDPVGLKMIA